MELKIQDFVWSIFENLFGPLHIIKRKYFGTLEYKILNL